MVYSQNPVDCVGISDPRFYIVEECYIIKNTFQGDYVTFQKDSKVMYNRYI